MGPVPPPKAEFHVFVRQIMNQKKTTISLDNAKPCPNFAFARRAMPDHKAVGNARCFKIFLAGFIVQKKTLLRAVRRIGATWPSRIAQSSTG